MMTPEERYRSDSAFATLVNTMHAFIEQAQFTPSELREAAILAAIKYEMQRPFSARIVLAETALDVLSRMADPTAPHGRAKR